MCSACDKIRSLPPREALTAIEVEVKRRPGSYEHFKRLLDALLGTEEPEQDQVLDEAWERGQRGP